MRGERCELFAPLLFILYGAPGMGAGWRGLPARCLLCALSMFAPRPNRPLGRSQCKKTGNVGVGCQFLHCVFNYICNVMLNNSKPKGM